jgi:hypothetical protein
MFRRRREPHISRIIVRRAIPANDEAVVARITDHALPDEHSWLAETYVAEVDGLAVGVLSVPAAARNAVSYGGVEDFPFSVRIVIRVIVVLGWLARKLHLHRGVYQQLRWADAVNGRPVARMYVARSAPVRKSNVELALWSTRLKDKLEENTDSDG